MSETMKKRYEDVSATLCAIHGLKYSHCLTREEAEAIESLLDDLMAEREKMKERVEELETALMACEDTITEVYEGIVTDSPLVRNSITSLKVED